MRKLWQIGFPVGIGRYFKLMTLGGLFFDEGHLFSRLLFGNWEVTDLTHSTDPSTFLIEFSGDEGSDVKKEFLLANLLFTLLMFESHGYLVSSGSSSGQLLSFQDGFIYFYSREEDVSGALVLVENFKKGIGGYPEWARQLIIKNNFGG